MESDFGTLPRVPPRQVVAVLCFTLTIARLRNCQSSEAAYAAQNESPLANNVSCIEHNVCNKRFFASTATTFDAAATRCSGPVLEASSPSLPTVHWPCFCCTFPSPMSAVVGVRNRCTLWQTRAGTNRSAGRMPGLRGPCRRPSVHGDRAFSDGCKKRCVKNKKTVLQDGRAKTIVQLV